MSQSSYAKIAGLQSEVGRVVITRVAGSELEYKRTLNMYRKDATCAVNNIRREQIKMRMKLGRYVRKLRQARSEHAKLIKEQEKRDKERALLEELHLRLKFEAAARTPEPEEDVPVIEVTEEEQTEDTLPPININLQGNAVFLQTGLDRSVNEELSEDIEENNEKQNKRNRKPSTIFNPMLPMIDEAEKETDDPAEDSEKIQLPLEVPDRFDLRVWDEEMSVSSYGGRIKRKNDVSFSDIMKLKYSGTKKMFDLVHKLARKHGIQDVVEKVPDPRDSVVLRGATNDSFRLQASVLYPMKYGYNPNTEIEPLESDRLQTSSKSPAMMSGSDDKPNEPLAESPEPRKLRKISVDSRRSMYLSGKYSKSSDGDSSANTSRAESPRKQRSRDLSMPDLLDRVSKIKIQQADRLASSQRIENEMISNYNLLTPSTFKPSSSRSSRSLPAVSKTSGKENKNVTWTEALGLLRAIHSLENLS